MRAPQEAEAAAELAKRLDALEAKEREGMEVMAQQDASASQKLAELASKHKDLHDSLQVDAYTLCMHAIYSDACML